MKTGPNYAVFRRRLHGLPAGKRKAEAQRIRVSLNPLAAFISALLAQYHELDGKAYMSVGHIGPVHLPPHLGTLS